MGVGLIVTIIMLGALLGLCARQTIGQDEDLEVSSVEDTPSSPAQSSAV